MTDHDKTARLFDEDAVRKAFGHPDWPRGTEIVCFCRRSDSRDIIELAALCCGWVIGGYRYIDDSPLAETQKPGQVIFALRSAFEWEIKPLPLTTSPLHFPTDRLKETGEIPIPDDLLEQMKRDYQKWRSQMIGIPDMSDDKTKE